MSNSVFSKDAPAEVISEGEGEGENEDDGPLEDVDHCDPSKSTGNYEYVQGEVLFKQVANKFRVEQGELIETVTVSLERFEGRKGAFLFVRLANKTLLFTGILVGSVSSMLKINDSSRNVELSGLLEVKGGMPSGLSKVKIQFREEADGEAFEKSWGLALLATVGSPSGGE